MSYAADTIVSVEKTRAELDTLLKKHGALQRVTAEDDVAGVALVGFTMAGRQIRLRIPLPSSEQWPSPSEASWQTKKKKTPARWSYWTKEQRAAWVKTQYDQACRSRWRGVLLIVKAKLEFIEYGLSTVEREFLADIALPNGKTVGDWLKPQLADAYAGGGMPPLLGAARGDK